MSYVIGINHYGASCIICDTRITYGQSGTNGTNDALKSGKLFEGCIYGVAGDVDEFKKFIFIMREELVEKYTLTGFWEKFYGFVTKYNFNKSKPFQLIIASRHTGDSKLYLMDSTEQSIQNAGDIVTIGSGKKLLDSKLNDIYEHQTPKIIDVLNKHNVPEHSYPYLYCLWLMERVQGIEASTLNNNGVGGYFHFTGQTSEFEARQGPAVYVISDAYPSRREIRHWIFRIAFDDNALVIDCPVEQARMIIVDVSIWPNFKQFDDNQREKYFDKINKTADNDPFYYFCGFGFLDPTKRHSSGFHFTTINDYKVSRKGEIDFVFKKHIEDNFS